MTRARKTLTLARFDRAHRLLDGMPESPAILRRQPTALPPPTPELSYRYQRLGWKNIDLDFAGAKPADQPIHRAIAALSVGSPLSLRQDDNGAWVLCDTRGTFVGKLSRSFTPPPAMRCIDAGVAAIHVRRIKDVGDEHKSRISEHGGSWEMIVPELVFAPAAQAM